MTARLLTLIPASLILLLGTLGMLAQVGEPIPGGAEGVGHVLGILIYFMVAAANLRAGMAPHLATSSRVSVFILNGLMLSCFGFAALALFSAADQADTVEMADTIGVTVVLALFAIMTIVASVGVAMLPASKKVMAAKLAGVETPVPSWLAGVRKAGWIAIALFGLVSLATIGVRLNVEPGASSSLGNGVSGPVVAFDASRPMLDFPEDGFSIAPPGSPWVTFNDAPDATVAYQRTRPPVAMAVIAEPGFEGSLEDLALAVEANLRSAATTIDRIDRGTGMIDEIPAIRVTGVVSVNGVPLQYETLCTAVNGFAYQVIAWGPPAASDAIREAGDAFGAAMRFASR